MQNDLVGDQLLDRALQANRKLNHCMINRQCFAVSVLQSQRRRGPTGLAETVLLSQCANGTLLEIDWSEDKLVPA